MTSSPKHSNRSGRAAFFTALVLIAPSAVAAHFTGTGPDSAIGVHDGRYIAGGKTYGTLDALEAAVRASRPASLLIVSCTPAATRSWLEAVPRFEDLPMHLDVSDGSSSSCSATMPVGASTGLAPADLAPAVEQYWTRRMP